MITAISSVNKNNSQSSVNQSKQVSFMSAKPEGDKVMSLLRNLSFTPKASIAEDATPAAEGIPKTGWQSVKGVAQRVWNDFLALID